ncbi:hypothetical protein SK128_013832 [Halocaridina rubra]|uniref:Uncharacterized protein n=1 Tax=Halocaridina rubra TaxID=373956 RepID=A0AAN8XUC5_HALRR
MVSGVENVTIGLQNNYLQSLPEDKFGSILRNTNFQSKVLVSGNPIVCDPGLCWLAKNTTMASCFDNFRCSNMEVNFIDLTTELLGC